MTTKLDFKIWRVSNDNDAFITWAIKDISSLTTETLEAAASTLEFVRVAWENTSQLIRQPIKTTFSLANWKKLLLTLPAVGSDVLMKASRLPFSTLDNGILYTVNNNLERIIDFTKANTTRLAGNIISKNGDSRFKLLRWLGIAIEWTGDAIGAVIKAPSGILAKWTSVIDEVLAKWKRTLMGLLTLQVTQ